MNLTSPATCRSSIGTVRANAPMSAELLRLDIDLDAEITFAPGQFAMLNLAGPAALVFGRPFSIMAIDGACVSFLYRVVGRGTQALARLTAGASMTVLGPLGTPFPEPDDRTPAVVIAGGVGLPPMLAWWRTYGRPEDQGFFGARHGGDVPWDLLPDRWQVSVDRHERVPAERQVYTGLVTELARQEVAAAGADQRRVIVACGPLPLLAACAKWAADAGWPCHVSLEEHMGCGYGACKGCVVPVQMPALSAGATGHATCCQDGPVFAAEQIDWPGLLREQFPTT